MQRESGALDSKRNWKKLGAILLRIWLPIHIVFITLWSLPLAPPGVANGRIQPYGSDWLLLYNDQYIRPSFLRHYLTWSGFWQYWDMFSPDPSDTDVWGDAEITFKDGTVRRFQYPRMYLLPIPEKYVKERYRKFYERVYPDAFRYVWPVFAQRIALENFRDEKNPPVKVVLTRHWLPLPKVGNPIGNKYESQPFFEYEVDQKALEVARKGS